MRNIDFICWIEVNAKHLHTNPMAKTSTFRFNGPNETKAKAFAVIIFANLEYSSRKQAFQEGFTLHWIQSMLFPCETILTYQQHITSNGNSMLIARAQKFIIIYWKNHIESNWNPKPNVQHVLPAIEPEKFQIFICWISDCYQYSMLNDLYSVKEHELICKWI